MVCSAGQALHTNSNQTEVVRLCRAAVQAFCSGVQCGLGGSGSIAMGPLGRQADAGFRMGTAGSTVVHSYSASRGAFAGEALPPFQPGLTCWALNPAWARDCPVQ